MNKTIKKLDNQIVKALTIACEQLKDEFEDFTWLTHQADFSNFPASLIVRCVFNTDAGLATLKHEQGEAIFSKRIHAALLKVGILLKSPKRHVVFDTEEACAREHQGNWKQRLTTFH
jgi:hypothetical protein